MEAKKNGSDILQEELLQDIIDRVESSPHSSAPLKEATCQIIKKGVRRELSRLLKQNYSGVENAVDMVSVVDQLTERSASLSDLVSVAKNLVLEGVGSPHFDASIQIIRTFLPPDIGGGC